MLSCGSRELIAHFFFVGGGLRLVKIISLILSQVNRKVSKMRDPKEKTPDHPQAELGLSHTHSGEMTSDLER